MINHKKIKKYGRKKFLLYLCPRNIIKNNCKMIEMNKKRIINLLTIVVLLLSYSGIWAQSGGCTSMPNPVLYTRVGTDVKFGGNKIAKTEGKATVNGVVVTRTLENERQQGYDRGVKYSDGKLLAPSPNTSKPVDDVAPCGTGANTKAGYPIMDSDKVRKLTYKFSKPVVDIELFFAEFGYKQLPNKIDYADIVLKSHGNVVPTQLTIRNDCNNGATKTIKNGKERLASLSGKVTDVKAGITSTEPFDEMILENASDNTGYGFYVEICLNSIQPLNISACTPGTSTLTSKFATDTTTDTKTLNGVEVTQHIPIASSFSNFTSNYCDGVTNVTYPRLPILGFSAATAKKLTYTFAKPITSAEIFLIAFGDNQGAVNTYDEVKFSVDGGGTMTLSQTYNCNPTGTKITGGLVRSADDKRITTDVGIKVSSTQPFTEIVLDDLTPTGTTRSGNGYTVAICESSIKLANTSTCTSDNIGTLFAANKTATYTTTSGVKVTRKMDPATGFASLSNTDYCSIAPTYPANLPLLVDSKVMTYEFDVPVTQAEVFLFAFGDEQGAPNTYDQVTFSTDNGTVSVTQTYSCNPSGITITNGKVRSVDNRKWTTDVGLKITSTKPFTKLILTDSTPTYGSPTSGNGYLVAFCESGLTKITQNELNNFITLDATISILADQSKCQQEAPTYKAKATANAFAATAKFDYILEVKRSNTSNWVAVETKSDVAPGTEYTFNANAFKTNNYHNAKVRVKYVYKNTLFPSVNGVAYSGEATYTLKDKPAITSLTASPTSLNETGATNITYTIKGTPGATVTYNINGGTPETLVLDPVTGVKTVDRSGQTAKTTLIITKVAKTGLCDLDNIAYKAEVDALGNSCTTHPSVQFAQTSPATATMNGIQVTRTIAGTQSYFQSYTYTTGDMCQPTIMQGYPSMNAGQVSIKYKFDKPITSAEVWLSGFGGAPAPARADKVTFTVNCGTPTLTASGCGSVTPNKFIITGNEVTHEANVYTQARVKVSSSVPFTELTLNDPGSTSGGYTVELCPGSIKPAKIKVTENPAELTACIGATGKYFTAKAKIDGVSGTEDMSYKWQQSRTNTPGSWVDAVATSPNGSIKADGSTQARLTLNTIQESNNGLYYRAAFSFTKCNKTLETVYSEPAKLNVPSASDIITITAPTQGNITTSDCTASTQVSVQAKVTDGYTIKNNGGGNLFGYFLQYKENGTWKDHATQKFSNNANDAAKKLIINHGQTASGTVFRVKYTVTLTTGCEYTVYSSEFTFTKNLPAQPAITTPQTFCQSQNKTLEDLTTLPNIKWYNAATGGNEVLASTLVGTNSYWATVTTNGCESDRKQVDVTVVAKPNAPTVQTKTECPVTGSGSTYDMKNLVTSSSGNTLKWYAAATGNTTTTSIVDRNKTAKTTYEKWVAQVTPQGCESDRVKVTYIVDITTQPTITAPASDLAINCADPAATVTSQVNTWLGTATGTVGCGTATVTNNYNTVKPADLCSVGEIEVTFTVTDAFGTQKTVKKKITVDRLIANNDTESVSRSTGKDIDVLANDTKNGQPATKDNVNVQIVNANGTGATVTSDGKIHIPGGTLAPGTYNVTYKICDKDNPSRCGATATVAVTITNSTIEANNDTPAPLTYATSVAYAKNTDGTELNVLANDKLSGATPTLSQVTIIPVTTATGVSIEPATGKVKVNASTPAGVYNLTYKIKENGTSNESTPAKVTVVVKNTLTATPATLTPSITPSTSATTPKVVGDVLDQTALNGNKPNTSQVDITVTQQATPIVAGDPVPSINTTTGKVEIPSGVKPGTYTIKYKLCDKVTPQTCTGEVTLPITVAAGNTIVAQNDDFSTNKVEHSSSEEVVKNGSNPVNVLANDKLDTRTGLDTNVVTITQTSPASAVNIDTATGQIKVAANTPAGVYEVKYKITEKGQTTASGEATAKVVVTNKVELTPATIPSSVNTPDDGNDKSIANVLDKAKINGNKPNVADVVITVPNPAHKDAPSDIVPYVDPATGNVIVPVGTKPGNHQITYKVCDKLPAGQQAAQTCKTATITIPVTANTATSANDDYSSNPVEFSSTATSYVKNGTDDANVLSNDALGSNTTITTNLVDITQTHTSNPGVTIETTTGKVKVAPNTPAGEYTLKYKIAEKGGGPSSAESTVKVVVKNKVVVNQATIPSSVTPATDGTDKEIGDVLDQTEINGAKPSAAQVTITETSPAPKNDPSDKVPYIDTTTGKVKIPAGVKPGNYPITYQICDKATPASANTCKTATITVKVAGNHLDPKNDDFSQKKVERSTSDAYVKDGANDLNVLSNDKLGNREGLDTNVVTIEQTYTSNNGVTVEVATGKVKVAANTPAGEYTVKYKITEKGQTTASNEVSVKVTVTNKLEVGTITIPNAKPSTNSTTPVSVGNILDQTKINGQLNPDPSQVEITATPDQPGLPKKPYIDTTTGRVMIPAGVAPGDHTISYKVCDKAQGAAKRCEEATVTVKVVSNTATSEDDDFTTDNYKVEHPTVDIFVSDGSDPVNVLSNDKLGSDTTISTDEVTITQTATSNSNVNIDTTTGRIKVNANTPAGVYTVKYKFTEKGQPASAASAEKTATVVVTNKLTSSNGNYGGAPSTNSTPANGGDVLNNVRINGAKPTPSQVTITVDNNAGSGTVPFLVTSGADAGKIKIPQGTPAGTYTIKYTVCDTASGAAKSCKTATANIRVSANAIIATNDEDNKEVEFATSAQNVKKSDNTTLNVLNNDTLAGSTATDTTVTIETTVPVTGITIKTNGEVEVAANKPAGVYELKYVIKETADINNVSDEAAVKVVVKNKVTFDPFPATPVKPSTDKNTPATPIDVIANTKINGSTPSANDVTIQVTHPADPQSLGDVVPVLNTTTGKVEIPAGVKPGTYNITYQICDKAQPAEAKTCKTNTVTITVTGNTITGADDDFSAYKVERSTSDKFVNDGTNDVNVLTNDTLGSRTGLTTDLVTITQTHTSEPKVTIDTATGKVKVAADAPAGTHTIKYTITEKGQTTPSAEKTVTVVVTNKIELTPTDVVSNPVTPSTDKNTPKEIGDVLDGTKLNGTKPGIGNGANQVSISVVTPAQPQSPGDAVPELDTTTGKVKIPAGVKPGTYNITYKVCDNATPQTCETSTIPITVQGNTTTSADDDFTAHKVVHPTTDTFVSDNGTPVNVLSNDKLGDDDSITTDEVEIIQTATTNPKVSIDIATGKVKVEANTPAGEYTVKYKFKEKGQPDTKASQEKTVTVVVTNQVEIDRANNNYTGAPSTNTTPANGGDVLDKVKINGNKPNANEVTITVDTPATGTTVPYLETSGADAGKIKIPQGTPAGNYTITYTVCDKAQPASARTCEQATATITVAANPIVANADNDNKVVEFATSAQAVKKTDGTTLNVLANDKLGATTGLNNTIVTIETTQPVANITIQPDGEVEVGANKAPGVYELKYKIKETADPTNVSTEATVKVVVKNKVELDAIPTTPANPSTDSTTPNAVVDILDNTKINGNKPNANEVTIEVVTPATPQSPGDIVPTIDTTTGKVVVPSGVKPGTYTIEYKVCDKAQPDEAKTCKTDTVRITVTGNTIQATADDFTAHKVERSNNDAFVKNGANEVNVLTNDELGTRTGIDTQVVTITQTATTDPKVTIDTATGKVKVAANAPAGEHVVKYKITEKGQTTASQEVEVKVVVTNKVESEDATYTGTTPTNSNPTTAGNILDHVHFNGGSQAPDPSEVTVEILTPAPGTTVPTIITTGADTGKIQIPQGTPDGTYPIIYKVCDKATGAANTCKTHTATVKVNLATTDIVAQPDTYTLQWDAAERTAEGNILVNDRYLTRENLDTTLVDIQQVAASTPDKVSIDTATGKVKIAAGTPAGTHTIRYTITPKGETSPVSAPALVTVVIKNKVELSDDRIPVRPSDDSTPAGNILDNVKVNGRRPQAGEVTLTVTPPAGSPVPSINPNTGEITVPGNVPAGDYPFQVQVCDRQTPATCQLKQIVVKVNPNQDLEAVDDPEYKVGTGGGTSTINVLDNDKLGTEVGLRDKEGISVQKLRTEPNIAEVTNNIVLETDGFITVKPGIAVGYYELYYEVRKGSMRATAKVGIRVTNVIAGEDNISVERSLEGQPDKVSEQSVLGNDNVASNQRATPETVQIEEIEISNVDPSGPAPDGKISLDPATGKIVVKPGAPIGEYTVKYKIRPKGSTSDADWITGEDKVKITPNFSVSDKDFTNPPVMTNQSPGVTKGVLDGYTLEGQPLTLADVTLTITDQPGISENVTFDDQGRLVIPQGTLSGTYPIRYKIKSNAYGVEKEVTVMVKVENDIALEFYNAISTDEGSPNNGFIIKNIEYYPDNNLKIFNRYGVLIFEKDGYTNASPFKGISEGRATVNKDGKLPQGTYYYILEYTDGKNQTQQKTGWLYIK